MLGFGLDQGVQLLGQGGDGDLLRFEGLGEMGEGGFGGAGGGSGEASPVEELDFLGVGAQEGDGTEALLGLVC